MKRNTARGWMRCGAALLGVALAASAQASLRFYGNGVNDVDRVKIPLNSPPVPADVGAGDFTIEFWMKALPGDYIPQLDASGNPTNAACGSDGGDWINGNILFDRALWQNDAYGDFGISMFPTGIAFGIYQGGASPNGAGLCGVTAVNDGAWHHVALTRHAASGALRLYVDGRLDVLASGPIGNVSYRDDRALSSSPPVPAGVDIPGVEPYLIVGAEKYSLADRYPSFSGWLAEVRLSNSVRYASDFPRPTQAFSADASTVALYRFNEGGGDFIGDSSGNGPSHGVRRFGSGGTRPAGPQWSDEAPFSGAGGVSTGYGSGGGGCTLAPAAGGELDLLLWLPMAVAGYRRWRRRKQR